MIGKENVIMCCPVRAIDEYSNGGMVINRENVTMCCLVRAVDGYRAMVEW